MDHCKRWHCLKIPTRVIITLMILNILFIPPILAQDVNNFSNYNSSHLSFRYSDEEYEPNRSVGSDFKYLFRTTGQVISAPFRWQKNDWYTAGAFGLATTGSFLLDDEVRDLMLNNRSKFMDQIERFGDILGTPAVTIPTALVVYLGGVVGGNNWFRDTGLMMMEELVIIALIQQPARIIAGRARPYTGEGSTSFNLFKGIDQDYASFISGHSATTIGFATILSEQIDNTWASIGLYILGSLTPISRLYSDNHWFSDIVMGVGLGYFSAKSILAIHKENPPQSKTISITPTLNGLSVSVRF